MSDRDLRFSSPAVEPEEDIFDIFSDRLTEMIVRMRERVPALTVGHLQKLAVMVARQVFADRSATSASQTAAWRLLSHVIAFISDSASPLLTMDVVCYCLGLNQVQGEAMRTLAGMHNISRQAFSKHVERTRTALGLPMCSSLRPVEQRRKYRHVHLQRWDAIRSHTIKVGTERLRELAGIAGGLKPNALAMA